MRKRSISKGIMLVAGFVAACVILLGPSFSRVKVKEPVKSEKATVLVQAPSEAIPGSAVKIAEPSVPLLTEIEEPEPMATHPVIRSEQITKYLKVLFRTVIAPNAP